MKPIFNHREIIGFAKTARQAERVISSTIAVHQAMTIHVFERDVSISDLPPGFVYSIFYRY